MVLVKNSLKPRHFWMLGTIIELLPGRECIVRSAHVRQGDGHVKVHSLRHLYPMGLSLSSNELDEVEINCSAFSPTVATGGSNSSHLSSTGLTPNEDESIWMCPACDAPQGEQDITGCDACDEWFYFSSVLAFRDLRQ